ncbi:MAG TPA: DNA-3-methyladenine glycosylase I [Chthoniobacterales bacterium]
MPPKIRCPWCPPGDELYEIYHDTRWGVPEYDGLKLFEMLNLEGAQAGLSWRTVLGRIDNYRKEFDDFDPLAISKWSEARIAKALLNPGIIRNRLKVAGVVKNARAFMTHFKGDPELFSRFLWDFVDGKPIKNRFRELNDFPARTEISDRMSKELKRRGFTFVGSTICYAFMQATGMVNDHTVTCFRFGK